MEKVTIDDIRNAQDTIKDIVKRTDILESTKLSLLTFLMCFFPPYHIIYYK